MKNGFWNRGIRKKPQLPKRCFISHAYGDCVSCEKLVRALPRGVKPIVYPPITVRPEQLVSTPLVKALSACDGLIYLTGGQSDRSFWVAFERDYALRLGKKVFSANPDTLEILMSTERPLDLAMFASYHHIERDRVRKVCDFMKKERNFDIWFDQERFPAGESLQEAMHSAIESYVSRGYVVVFWSRKSAQSEWVEYEYRTASDQISNFNDRVLFALLDETAIPDFWMKFHEPAVQIYGDEVRSEAQRLDDLIVRLYWLIHKKSEQCGIHAEG